jgi:mono/diheme cytochrome c family protein
MLKSSAALLVLAAVIISTLLPAPALAATVEENYRFYCAQCHGLKGEGDGPNATRNQPVDPRDHTSAYEMSKLTDEDLINVIRDGGVATSKSTLMPPFKKTLSRSEILELKEYIRKLCRCTGD